MFSQKSSKWWRNPWVIGMFLIVMTSLAVNGRMIWNAMNSDHRWLDKDYKVKDHHRHGAEWVEQERRRSALGWGAHLHSPQEAKNDPMAAPDMARLILTSLSPQLMIDMHDREGLPLEGVAMKIQAQWPSGSSRDFEVSVREVGKGQYEALPVFPRPGNWILRVEATHGQDGIQLEQKVFVAAER